MPLKLCRFMTPVKPLPLLTAVTSTRSPTSRTSAVISWPTSYPSVSSSRSSTRRVPGSTPACSKCPASGLFSFDGRTEPKVTWSAL